MITRRNALGLSLRDAPPRGLRHGSGPNTDRPASWNGEYRLAPGDRLRIIVSRPGTISRTSTPSTPDGADRDARSFGAVARSRGATTRRWRRIVGRAAARGLPARSAGHGRGSTPTGRSSSWRGGGSPGQYAYVDGLTVQTAVAIAGGFSPRANRVNAEISRVVGDAIVTEAVPMTFPVQPGDTITVAERWL